MWKDWVRPFVRPLPQWTTVAVAPPQQVVTAIMHGNGKSMDVTADHSVASLDPLVIATSIDAGASPIIEYSDNATGRLLGVLHLAKMAMVTTGTTPIALYHVAAGAHRCLRWPRRPWNAWLSTARRIISICSRPPCSG